MGAATIEGPAAERLSARRRRVSQREESREHRRLAKLLAYYLDPETTFWSSLENKPRSAVSGLLQKLNGVRSGLPDVLVIYRRKTIFIELKSKRGVVSKGQKQARVEILQAGARWWLTRSALAALTALHRSGVVFRHPWRPRQLPLWQGPFPDPNVKMPWAPIVQAEWREAKRREAARRRAQRAAKRAALAQMKMQAA
jgi:hypothetical protein